MRKKKKVKLDSINSHLDVLWEKFKFMPMTPENIFAMECSLMVSYQAVTKDAYFYTYGNTSKRIKEFKFHKSATGALDLNIVLAGST